MDSTTVASAAVRFLLAFFLTAIAVVPIVEWAGVRARDAEGAGTAWSRLAGFPVRSVPTLPVRPFGSLGQERRTRTRGASSYPRTGSRSRD